MRSYLGTNRKRGFGESWSDLGKSHKILFYFVASVLLLLVYYAVIRFGEHLDLGIFEIFLFVIVAFIIPFFICIFIINIIRLITGVKSILKYGIIGIIVGFILSFFIYIKSLIPLVSFMYYFLTFIFNCKYECTGLILIYPGAFMLLFGLIGLLLGGIIYKIKK